MADRYWVGGTGTWNTSNTANWSASSGGPTGASVPTAADSVFFNGASASGNYTVTLTGALNCLDLNIAQATAGTLGTVGTGTIGIAGNLNANGTGVTWGSSGTWTFNATTAKTITSGGLTLPVPIVFNGAGGTWQLQDNFTASVLAVATTTLTTGTLDLNAKTFSTSAFISNGTGVRGIIATGATVNVTGNSTSPWTTSTITNLTVTGRLTVNATYSGATGTRTMSFGALAEAVAPDINITAGTDTVQVTGSVTNLSTTGFSGTFNGGLRTIYGNLTIAPTTLLQPSASATTLSATSGTKTISTGNLLLPFPMTFNGANATTWQMQNNFIQGNSTTHSLTLTTGQLDFNNYSANIYVFLSNGTGLRGIGNIGGNTMNVTGIGATVLNLGIVTNFTMPQGYTINLVGNGLAGTTRTTSFGAFAENANPYAPNINFSAGADNVTIGTGTIRDLDFTGFSGNLTVSTRSLVGNLVLSNTMTVVPGSGGTTSFTSTSGVKTITTNGRPFVTSLTVSGAGGTLQLADNLNMFDGSTLALLTLTSGNLDLNDKTANVYWFNSNSSLARILKFGTSGVINIGGNSQTVWNSPTVTNFSYTGNARVNITYSGATGTRTINHGSVSGISEATKAPPIYVTAGTDQVSTGTNTGWSDLVFESGANVIFNNTGRIIYGNLVLNPGMTLATGALVTSFVGNGIQTLDSANLTLDFPIAIGSGVSNGNLTLANTTTLGSSRALTLTAGNLVANGFNITAGTFVSNNANPRTLNISNVTISLASVGTVWSMGTSTNATVIATNSNILLTNTTTNARTFAGGSLTYGNLDIGGATGTSTLTVTGNNTFAGALTSSKTVAHTIAFTAGTTTTVGAFTVTGTANNTVTIGSTTSAQHNLVLTGGGNVTTVDYLNIAYSNASPAVDTWYPGVNSVNFGNNNGWMFPAPIGGSSNFFLVF